MRRRWSADPSRRSGGAGGRRRGCRPSAASRPATATAAAANEPRSDCPRPCRQVRHGALAGMAGGSLIWAHSLLLPSLSQAGWLPTDGILGGGPLPPLIADLDPLTNGAAWSLLVN